MADIQGFVRADIILDTANDYIYSPQMAQQNDLRGRTLYVQIRNGGVVQDQTGLQLILGWSHKDTHAVGLDSFEAADITEGIFSLPYPQAMLQPGIAVCSIMLTNTQTGQITHSRNFNLNISPTAYNMEAVAADNSFTTLQQILQLWFDLPDNVQAATDAAIADFEEKAQEKLDSIRVYFKGNFPSLEELQATVPTALAGDYAFVGTEGTDATVYIWDETDSKWVASGISPDLTPEMVSSLYESVPDVNRYTTADKTAVTETIPGQITTLNGQITTLNGQVTDVDGRVTALAEKTKVVASDGVTEVESSYILYILE